MDMIFNRIKKLLEDCSDSEKRCFVSTTLYNEGWMMILVMDWFERNKTDPSYPLTFPKNGKWYSETSLRTPFPTVSYKAEEETANRTKCGESYTHADGAIGHFELEKPDTGKGYLLVNQDTEHFVIVEAKIYSKLRLSVKNAKGYNQAARTVACMATVLQEGKIEIDKLTSLGFYVLAPKSQIDKDVFKKLMTRENIRNTVEKRMDNYYPDLKKDWWKDWWKNWFEPTLEKIDIQTISWEDIITEIKGIDLESGENLCEFYQLCLKFNKNDYQKK